MWIRASVSDRYGYKDILFSQKIRYVDTFFLTNEHEIVPISLIEKVDMWIRFIIFEKQLM